MSFFLALGQVGFLKHVYFSALHELFEVHTIKSKTIHVEYAGSGQYVGTFEVGPTTTFDDVIPKHHVAFHGHNGLQIYDLLGLRDQDTITIRKQVFRGELVHTLREHNMVQFVEWNPQGTLFASGSWDYTIKIWDTNTWKCVQTLEGHTKCVNSVAWNCQGILASGSADTTIKIWDTKSRECLYMLEGHTNFVYSVAWNSQGRLASGSWDTTIKIWDSKDSKTWNCVQTLGGHTLGVRSVAWNSQGTKLASGSFDNTIKIWDTNTWKCVKTLEGHTSHVKSVAWNSQGTLLASGSGDATIMIWDTTIWNCIQTLEGHMDWVSSVAWNSQGRLASGSEDKTIKIWK